MSVGCFGGLICLDLWGPLATECFLPTETPTGLTTLVFLFAWFVVHEDTTKVHAISQLINQSKNIKCCSLRDLVGGTLLKL